MNISTETREILRNYRAVINAQRREMGQKPLTTAQIVDEICDFVAKQVIQGQAVEAACQPARPPGRLTPAGREAGHADASPVTLPVCDVSGIFFF